MIADACHSPGTTGEAVTGGLGQPDALEGRRDQNGDRIVTCKEVYQFVSDQAVEATRGRQHPQRTAFGGVPLSVVPETGTGEEDDDRP